MIGARRFFRTVKITAQDSSMLIKTVLFEYMYCQFLISQTLISQNTSYIKEYSWDAIPYLIYISTHVISNYRYLKVNFLVTENFL